MTWIIFVSLFFFLSFEWQYSGFHFRKVMLLCVRTSAALKMGLFSEFMSLLFSHFPILCIFSLFVMDFRQYLAMCILCFFVTHAVLLPPQESSRQTNNSVWDYGRFVLLNWVCFPMLSVVRQLRNKWHKIFIIIQV